MNKEFVPYEKALALKELGFDEPCFSYYQFKELSVTPRENGDDIKYQGDIKFDRHTNSYLEENDDCSAPLYQQAFRWFREKGFVNETYIPLFITKRISVNGDTYEEAELECLKKLIEIVKTE